MMVICCDIIDQQNNTLLLVDNITTKPYSYSGLLLLQSSDTPGATVKSEA